jgi:hypothetical protein
MKKIALLLALNLCLASPLFAADTDELSDNYAFLTFNNTTCEKANEDLFMQLFVKELDSLDKSYAKNITAQDDYDNCDVKVFVGGVKNCKAIQNNMSAAYEAKTGSKLLEDAGMGGKLYFLTPDEHARLQCTDTSAFRD